jgi:glycosyltransferase involved in cell wall biosynthesis
MLPHDAGGDLWVSLPAQGGTGSSEGVRPSVWIFGDLPAGAACGPAYMVESWARELSAMGWQTRRFTPSGSWRRRRTPELVTFRTVRNVGFHGDFHARFSGLAELWHARTGRPDVVLSTTPGRVGILGVSVAARYGVPLVLVESTDTCGAVNYYNSLRMLVSGGVKPLIMLWAAPRIREVVRCWPWRSPRRLLDGRVLAGLYAAAVRGQAEQVVLLSTKPNPVADDAAEPAAFGSEDVDPDADGPAEQVIPSGIDRLPACPPPEELRWRPGALRVLYVGRLAPEKSLWLLVDALRTAVDQGVDVHLAMVGAGRLRDELVQRAQRAGVADRLSVLGPYPRDTLAGVYASADVFAFPSVVETQAFVLNEASHEGLPLLVSDPDTNPVVRAGVSALVVPHDPDSYAEGMRQLQDARLRRLLGEGAQRRARQFSERGQAALLSRTLHAAVQPRRTATLVLSLRDRGQSLSSDGAD